VSWVAHTQSEKQSLPLHVEEPLEPPEPDEPSEPLSPHEASVAPNASTEIHELFTSFIASDLRPHAARLAYCRKQHATRGSESR
jgi:hypothetical protein